MQRLITAGWRFWDGWVAVFAVAAAISALDGAYLGLVDGRTTAATVLGAMAMALWAVVVALGPAAVVLGLALIIAGRADHATWLSTLETWLTTGSPEERTARAATLLVAFGFFLLGMVAVGAGAFVVHREITREHFQAIAIALHGGGVVLALALAYPFCRRVVFRVVSWVAAVPVLGWPLRSPVRLAVGIGSVSVLVGACVVWRHWQDTLRYVPWSLAFRLAGAVVLSAALYQGWREVRRLPGVRRAVTAVVALGLVLLTVAAVQLDPSRWELRRLAFSSAIGGSLARQALRSTLDSDHDGFLPFLGDGDCAPADPKVYYGAPEVPDNAIDEDCDGEDLSSAGFTVYPPARAEGADKATPRDHSHARADGGAVDDRDDPRSGKQPLDVVLITVDALAAARLGAMGYARPITPNLDRLAAQSAFFIAAFSQGPSTRLSLPSMLTSKWDSLIKRTVGAKIPYSLASEEKQLQEVLLDAGYDTVAVIPDRNFVPTHWRSATRGFSTVDDSAVGPEHNAERVTASALKALGKSRSRPLFLWVHYYDPHSPYHQPKDVTVFGKTESDRYDAEVLYTDRSLQPLLDALRDRPRTLTIVTADHGTVFHPKPQTRRAHYGYDLYTATLHVPLMFHASFIAPQRWEGAVSTMDIYPTLVALLGLKNAGPLSGLSLGPILSGDDGPVDRITYHQFYLPERALRDKKDGLVKASARDQRFDLIVNRDDGSYELYDWRADYYEMNNLALDPNYRDELQRLRRKLGAFIYATRPK